MDDFYRLLATHYDRLFPAEPHIVEFLADEFEGARTLIDAACGTGNYTDALTGRGFDCRGFDASEDMIDVARSRAKRGRFEVRDLRRLGDLHGVAGEVGGLFCIGNSLPHLANRDQVKAFFRDAAALLAPAASLVVQTVNFSRFAGREAEVPLPPAEYPDITMRRSYRRTDQPGTVLFHVELATGDGENASGDTQLLALEADELSDAAVAAGFRQPVVFGSYECNPYERESSFLQILSARRG